MSIPCQHANTMPHQNTQVKNVPVNNYLDLAGVHAGSEKYDKSNEV